MNITYDKGFIIFIAVLFAVAAIVCIGSIIRLWFLYWQERNKKNARKNRRNGPKLDTMEFRRINEVDEHISVLWISIWEYVLFYDESVIGMFHRGFLAARIEDSFLAFNEGSKSVTKWLSEKGFRIDATIDSLGLCEWQDVAYISCEDLIKESREGKISGKLQTKDKS